MIRIFIAFTLLTLAFCESAYSDEVVINNRQTQLVVPFAADPFSSCSGLPARTSPNTSDPLYILPGADWRQLITPTSLDDSGSDIPIDLTGRTITVSFAPSTEVGPYGNAAHVPLSGDYAASPDLRCIPGYTLIDTTCVIDSGNGRYVAQLIYSCISGGILSGTTCSPGTTVDVVSGVLDIRIPADQTLAMAAWQGNLSIMIDGLELSIPVEIVPTVSRP
jgi:hypothetical protein